MTMHKAKDKVTTIEMQELKRNRPGLLSKLGRIFMSTVLVMNLVPVLPANAADGDGGGDSTPTEQPAAEGSIPEQGGGQQGGGEQQEQAPNQQPDGSDQRQEDADNQGTENQQDASSQEQQSESSKGSANKEATEEKPDGKTQDKSDSEKNAPAKLNSVANNVITTTEGHEVRANFVRFGAAENPVESGSTVYGGTSASIKFEAAFKNEEGLSDSIEVAVTLPSGMSSTDLSSENRLTLTKATPIKEITINLAEPNAKSVTYDVKSIEIKVGEDAANVKAEGGTVTVMPVPPTVSAVSVSNYKVGATSLTPTGDVYYGQGPVEATVTITGNGFTNNNYEQVTIQATGGTVGSLTRDSEESVHATLTFNTTTDSGSVEALVNGTQSAQTGFKRVVVDMTNPTVAFAGVFANATCTEGVGYDQSGLVNPDVEEIYVKITAEDTYLRTITVDAGDTAIALSDGVAVVGPIDKGELTTAGGKHITYYAEDYSGRMSEIETMTLRMADKPELSEWTLPAANKYTDDENTKYYSKTEVESNGNAVMTIKKCDYVALEDGKAKVTVSALTDKDGSLVAVNNVVVTEKTDEGSGTYYEVSVPLEEIKKATSENTKYKLVAAVDGTCNVKIPQKASDSFVIDTTGPQIEVKLSGPLKALEGIANFFKGTEPDSKIGAAFISATDPLFNTAASMIVNTTEFKATEGGDFTWESVVGKDNAYGTSIPYASEDNSVTFKIGEGNSQTLDLEVSDLLGNVGTYEYRAEDVDDADVTVDSHFVVDVTSPDVEVVFDKADESGPAFNGKEVKVYKADGTTARVVITDANFNRDCSEIFVYKFEAGSNPVAVTDNLASQLTQDDVDKTKWTATISIGAGDTDTSVKTHYGVYVNAKDMSGNKSTVFDPTTDPATPAGNAYVLFDNQAPVVDIAMSAKPHQYEKQESDYYKGASVTATITVTDVNLASAQVTYTEKGSTTKRTEAFEIASGATSTTKELIFEEAANPYEVTVETSDAYGNKTTYVYGTPETDNHSKTHSGTDAIAEQTEFIVDNTKPSITIAMDDATPAITASSSTSDYYDANSVTATITIEDLNYDEESSTIALSNNSESISIAQAVSDGKLVRDGDGRYTGTFNAGSTVHMIDVVAKDYATNDNNAGYKDRTDSSSDINTFIVDNEELNINSVTFNVPPVNNEPVNGNDYFASIVKAVITVTDSNFNTSSPVTAEGSKSVVGWTASDGKYTATISYEDTTNANLTFKAYDEIYSLGTTEQKQAMEAAKRHYKEWSYEDKTKEPDITLASDATKSFRTGSSSFVVDTKHPTVDVAINKASPNSVGGIDYYREVVEAKIRVDDANLSTKALDGFTLLGTEEESFPTTGATRERTERFETEDTFVPEPFNVRDMIWEILDGANKSSLIEDAESIKTNHQTTYRYGSNDEGSTSTKAGGKEVRGPAYCIDLTDPQIDVAIDQHYAGTTGGIDYIDTVDGNMQAKATITVVDTNFDSDSIKLSDLTADGVSIERDWEQEATDPDTWTATLVYDENKLNNPYGLSFTAMDKATRETQYTYGPNRTNVTTKIGRDSDEPANPSGKEFVIDATQPEVTVSFDQTPQGDINGIDYYSADIVATVTVKDRNFDADNSNVTIDGMGAFLDQGWSQNGEKWTRKIKFKENPADSMSTLSVFAQDLVKKANAGSGTALVTNHADDWAYKTGERDGKSPTGSAKFVIDKTQPTIDVSIDRAPQQVNYRGGVDYYAGTTGDTLEVTITATDDHFDPNTSLSQVLPIGGFGHVSQTWKRTSGTNKWVAKVIYTENDGGSTSDLQVTAQDFVYTVNSAVKGHNVKVDYGQNSVAGDQSNLGSSFILDCTVPTIDNVVGLINYSGIYNAGGAAGYIEPYLFYNGRGAGIHLDLADNNGLQTASINAPFSMDGSSYLSGIDALKLAKNVALIEGTSYNTRNELDRNIELKITDHANNYSKWRISPDGKVCLVAAGTETAHHNTFVNDLVHAATHPQKLVLDTTKPMLSWSTSVQEGSFYNTTQQVTMNIEELNFDYLQAYDGGQTVITVDQYAGSAGRALTNWTRSVSNFAGSGANWSHTLVFENDGHYVLHGKLTDPANNSSQIEFREFTIDKTAPRIVSITYDNNDVRNGKYYKAARTATITVEEHNWNDAMEGSFITSNGSIGGWSHNGDIHTATVYFGTDGDYNLSVNITDKAGNSASQTEPEFTVDLTAPKIEFANVENEHAYGDNIAPQIIYTDEKNFDNNGITWELTGAKNGQKNFAAGTAATGNGATVSYGDFDRVVESDDIYTLKAHMTDLAGNEADGEIVFSVNRFGSNFIVRDAQQYKDNSGYLATAPVVIVDEINVTGAEDGEHGVTVTRGLDTKNLKMQNTKDEYSDGFFIDSGKENYGWAHYTYHVGTGNYKNNVNDEGYDDGSYHVIVNSQDIVENNNNSANYYDPSMHDINSAEVAFTLDTTAPIVENLHVEEAGLFSSEGNKVSFTALDNIGLDNVTYFVNDEMGTFKQGETSEYSFDVPMSLFGDTQIAIVAKDLAGNYSDGTVDGDATVTPNEQLVQAGTLTVRAGIWRYLPLIIATVGVVGAAIFIVVRRRDNSQDAA